MSADVRVCPHCGKKLRVDNRVGVCSACQVQGRTLANAPEAPDASLYDVKTTGERTASKPARAKSDVLKRFRVVAAALDEDADALLEAFAESWLAQLKERVASED